nr:S-methyl-5-thioribose-1-phosphate isomerase [Hippea jasoniae]
MDGYSPIIVKDSDDILLLDQRILPQKKEYLKAVDLDDFVYAIREMVVRGAPLIGIVAAFGYYVAIRDAGSKKEIKIRARKAKEKLSRSRPTAVNLFYALDIMEKTLNEKIDILPSEKLKKKLRAVAFGLWESQKEEDLAIASNGVEFFKDKETILTHCNTGSLATGGIGTALGIIKMLFKKGSLKMVYVDETRPYLQGARLTAFELSNEGIPYKIITDNTAGLLIAKGMVDGVVVGADRIAANGDVANKIGTYMVALAAKQNNVDFVVAAPESTIDRDIKDGSEIVIEQRSEDEVLNCGKCRIAPGDAHALHYGFDITPSYLISAIITQKKIYRQPYEF